MKSLIKNFLYYGGYYWAYSVFKSDGLHRLLILMYHDLIEDDSQRTSAAYGGKPTRSQFEAQIKYISKNYRIIPVEDAVDEIAAKGDMLTDSVAITFDDGYSSVYNIAYPILKKYRSTATVYLLTDWINGKLTPWWLQLVNLIDNISIENLDWKNLNNIMGFEVSAYVVNSRGRAISNSQLFELVENQFRNKPDEENYERIREMKKLVNPGTIETENKKLSPMTWENVLEMAQHGFRFGAHTRSHRNLNYTDSRIAEDEISGSKSDIEKYLPGQVKGFAYPYGIHNNTALKIKDILAKNGFDYAVTTDYGCNNSSSNPYFLRRSTMPLTSSRALIARNLTLDKLGKHNSREI